MTLRRIRVIAAVACLLGATLWFAARLPSGPDVVWARVLPSLGVKPWADVRDAPNGAPVPCAGAWFWPAADVSWPPGERWDESLHVVLECKMPFIRSAVAYMRHTESAWSKFAEYRSTPDRVVIGGETWVRYVAID